MSKFKLDLQFFAGGGGRSGQARTNSSSKSYNPSNLGVKKFGGEKVRAGNIIIRQRGTTYKCGVGVYVGIDFTVHAKYDGIVKFYQNKARHKRTFVSVLPLVK